ncbi:MAG: transposase [Gammaproteobacteria bacterium]|nr:transposase [Gammaproteobacteria bacterium]
MTYPRSHLIDRENGGFYHLITRCVRQAWLCGKDPVTGRSFDHRRQWIEDRMLKLATCFTVELYAYAVMSNHYHIVLHVDPKAALELSDKQVAKRWVTLCPPTRYGEVDEGRIDSWVEALMNDPKRVEVCRRRLGDLSWFMRFMNEHIARRANAEDGCTGRFWQGRFESNVLLDERAAYSCMVYVDLNPIRAGITNQLEKSEHTSVKRRIDLAEESLTTADLLAAPLRPLNDSLHRHTPRLEISLGNYLALVDWTGRIVRDDKAGAIPSGVVSVVDSFGSGIDVWLPQVLEHREPNRRAFGAAEAMKALAKRIGQHWLKGSGQARLRPSATAGYC